MRLLLPLQNQPEQQQPVPPKVILYCDYCGKEFVKRRCDVIKSDSKFGGRNYCSRICFAKCRPSRYDKYYYCVQCREWIPQSEAILKPKGTININVKSTSLSSNIYETRKDTYYCPKCDSKGIKKGKLRLNSKKSRLNHKRKKVKRL